MTDMHVFNRGKAKYIWVNWIFVNLRYNFTVFSWWFWSNFQLYFYQNIANIFIKIFSNIKENFELSEFSWNFAMSFYRKFHWISGNVFTDFLVLPLKSLNEFSQQFLLSRYSEHLYSFFFEISQWIFVNIHWIKITLKIYLCQIFIWICVIFLTEFVLKCLRNISNFLLNFPEFLSTVSES